MPDDLFSDICDIKINYKHIENDVRRLSNTISSLFVIFATISYIPFFIYKITNLTGDLLFLIEILSILFFVGLYFLIKFTYKSIKYLRSPYVNSCIARYCSENDKYFYKDILLIIIEFIIFISCGCMSLYFLVIKDFNPDIKLFAFLGAMNAIVFVLFPITRLISIIKNDVWMNIFLMDVFKNYTKISGILTVLSVIFRI